MAQKRNGEPGRCGTDGETLAIEERRGRVYDLRLTGKSVRDIAADIGCCPATVHRDLVAVLDRLREDSTESAEKARQIDLHRLDVAQAALWPSVQSGETAAIDTYLRLQARRSKLLGLDAPEQQIHQVSNVTPEEAARLVREAFGEKATPRTEGGPPGDDAA